MRDIQTFDTKYTPYNPGQAKENEKFLQDLYTALQNRKAADNLQKLLDSQPKGKRRTLRDLVDLAAWASTDPERSRQEREKFERLAKELEPLADDKRYYQGTKGLKYRQADADPSRIKGGSRNCLGRNHNA